MKKGTWILFCALAVAVCGLLSVILLLSQDQSTYGLAMLAVMVTVAAVALLFAAQNILESVARIHEGMVSFNPEESKEFVDAVDTSYSAGKSRERASSSLSALNLSAPLPAAPEKPEPLPMAPVTTQVPAAPSSKQDNYKPLSGLSLSSPGPASNPSPRSASDPGMTAPVEQIPAVAEMAKRAEENFENTLGHGSINGAPSVSGAMQKLEEPDEPEAMETTQSFLPEELQYRKSQEFKAPPPPPAPVPPPPVVVENQSPDATLGYAPAAIENNRAMSAITPAMEAKGRAKLTRKRYSTFAGLSLNDSGSMPKLVNEQAEVSKEDLLTPPPPPPPALPRGKEKVKKRYNTFAGLSLNDRGPRSVSPEAAAAYPASAIVAKQLGTATNLQFNKMTDSMPMPTESGGEANLSVVPPARPAPKVSRKRYQTFMGLSLSKTPQPIKRYEERADGTAPLPISNTGANQAPASEPRTPINKGQLGNLVDGFCSLCGSPQAAGHEYSGVQSEPEFCWYCGAKLKLY